MGHMSTFTTLCLSYSHVDVFKILLIMLFSVAHTIFLIVVISFAIQPVYLYSIFTMIHDEQLHDSILQI